MKFIERLGQQTPHWIWIEVIAFVTVVAVIDVLTTWQFSMFIFYCLPVYVVSLNFSRRVGIGFALVCAVVAAGANLDSIAVRGFTGFSWAAVNRTCGLLLAAACGISFRQYREEMQLRFEALLRSQELEREVLLAGEIERKKIGHDLHDGVCQTLAALDCAAQCLKLDLDSQYPPLSDLATQIQKQLSNATLEARNMARGIYPVSLSAETLPRALQELASTMSRLFGGTVKVRFDADFAVANSEMAMHLYRITQEALSNALRHANSTRIEVQARKHGELLSLTVSDDGCGSALQQSSGGMGWHTMRYRANLIGARFTVNSQAGVGTTIRCDLPVA